MLTVLGCIVTTHDFRLLAIATVICGVAWFTTLRLLQRATGLISGHRWAWLAAGGAAFGSGVWITHFVAMLAYTPTMPIAFDVPLTLLSLAFAVAGGWCALWLALMPGRAAASGAGLLLGVTIGAMHSTGMAAFRTPGVVDYSLVEVVFSLVTGCTFGVAAMIKFHHGRTLQAACLLLLAVVGLHILGMAAVVIVPNGLTVEGVGKTSVAVAAAAAGLLILIVSLGSVLLDTHLEQRTASEDARFRRFAEATFEGLFFLKEGLVVDVNNVLCCMLGVPREQVVGKRLTSFFDPQHGGTLDGLQASATQGTEVALLAADGTKIVVDVLVRPLVDVGDGMVVIAVRDASERKIAERRIQELAHIDPLTGLANRLLLRDRLVQSLAMADRADSTVAVLCLDLDRFKAVNDIMGHAAGDHLLVEVSNRLRMAVRQTDTVARLGGDEFVVVQPFAGQPLAAQTLAERLLELLAEPVMFDGCRIEVTTSIGIAMASGGSADAETLLKQADLALYRTKQEGRNGFRFFEPEMDLKLQARREIERDLRQAVANGELHLKYQPVFEREGLDIVGYEALVRWSHPIRGEVSPIDFISVAEECGAILAIGAWVLETACREAAAWVRPSTISVNLSPVQVKTHGLVAQVANILERTGLPPSRLELEITEGVLIEQTEQALFVLSGLKSLGIRIALDDFGTGYSSLSYLRRFPFDRLKIDRSFVAELGEDADADAIVRSIMAMSGSLRLAVTAEGVETDQQLQILQAMGLCDLQGYLLGRPMSASDLFAAIA